MAWVYLDDHFPDHPKVARAGGDAALLFIFGLAYVRRLETAGRIPAAQVPRLTDRKHPMKLAERLVQVGLWEKDEDGFLVHDYDEWNRPQESRKAAARKAAKARWDRERDAKAHANASVPHSERSTAPPADRCPTPLTPSPSSTSSSSEPLSRPAEDEEDPRIGQAIAALVRFDAAALEAKGEAIRHRNWFTKAAENRRGLNLAALCVLVVEHPDWTGEQLAEAILEPKATASADAVIRERNARRARGETCPKCDDGGVYFNEEKNLAEECPCKWSAAS